MQGRIIDAHPAPIHTILHLEDGNVIATGDDDGMIRIWDLRMASNGKKHSICMEFKEHEGTISQMAYRKDLNQLVSASCDGMMGVFDLRKKNLYAMSDHFEEDLLGVVICKEGKKVLASTSEGIINVFSWDWFGDSNDRIVGHPGSIDTMIMYDEDIIITGCEDGLIRAISVLPNKIVAILGDPLDAGEEVFHIQKVTMSHDKMLLASCTLDDAIKIIDISTLKHRVKDEDFDQDKYEANLMNKANHGKQQETTTTKEGEEEQWESGSDDSDMSDDSDDSNGQKKKQKKKDPELNPKNATL